MLLDGKPRGDLLVQQELSLRIRHSLRLSCCRVSRLGLLRQRRLGCEHARRQLPAKRCRCRVNCAYDGLAVIVVELVREAVGGRESSPLAVFVQVGDARRRGQHGDASRRPTPHSMQGAGIGELFTPWWRKSVWLPPARRVSACYECE